MSYRTPTSRPALYDDLRGRAMARAGRAWLARGAVSAAMGTTAAVLLWMVFALSLGVFHHPMPGPYGPADATYAFDPRQIALVTLSSAPVGLLVAYLSSRVLRGPFARAVARDTRASCEGMDEHDVEELATSAAALV